MAQSKSTLTAENIKNLEMARLTYQGRMRDWINRRAEELMKFANMQSSVIMQPNQQEMQAQVIKLQQHDFEIKRLSDLIWAATVMLTFAERPEILDNIKNVRDLIAQTYEVVIDTKKDLQSTKAEEVFAVTAMRDMMQFMPALYPTSNPFEEVGAIYASRDPANQRPDDPGMLDSGLNVKNDRGVDGLTGSLLVSV